MYDFMYDLFPQLGLSLEYFFNFTKGNELITLPTVSFSFIQPFFPRQIALDFIQDDQTIVCAFDFLHKEDIGTLSLVLDYRSTVLNRVPFVARIVKNVAAEMYMHNVLENFDDFQIIGFSLGTHIAGITARLLQTEFNVTVPRIFGKCYHLFNQISAYFQAETLYIFVIKLLIRQKHLF